MPFRALAISMALACAPTAAAQDNVLIIIADDLGVERVNAYGEGNNPAPTPNIDALAASGVMFRNVWSNPVCSSTRACIHTGRYAFRHGIGNVILWEEDKRGQPVMSAAEFTLPELLDAQQSGYSHGAIGKWHLGDASNGGSLGPNLAGWQDFAGMIPGGGQYSIWPRTVNGETSTSTVYSTTQMVDDTLAYIAQTPEPWVCYLSFQAPHTPFHAPPASLHQRNLNGLSPAVTPVPFYRAMVEAMDTEIGRLLTTMGQPLVDRTNVIFVADNGSTAEITEPPFKPMRAKGTVYEGGINVPLIVAGPAVTSPGRVDDALVGTVDLFATIAELCGVSADTKFIVNDSVSFVPHLTTPGLPSTRSTVYSEWFTGDPDATGYAAIRDSQYKLIRRFYANPPLEELYDLTADPLEDNDLLLPPISPQNLAIAQALRLEMSLLRFSGGGFAGFGGGACAGSTGTPTISGTGSPTVDDTYSVHLTGAAPSQPAVLFLGSSRTNWNGIPLPFSLASISGGPGCFLHASGELLASVVTSPTGDASVQIPIPNAYTLIASLIHHSWLIVDPTAPNNPLGVVSTDGLTARVGS